MASTARSRPAPTGIRLRRTRIACLLVAIAAIAVAGHHGTKPASTATWIKAARDRVLRDRPSETGTGRLGLGEADGAVPDGTTVFDDGVPGVGKLQPGLLVALRRAATDAAGDGVELDVDSGWRSAAYQARLLREAVQRYGSRTEASRWVATPRTSAHVAGEAVDIGPVEAASWLAEHGAAHGLCRIYANEPWHFELRPEAAARGCPATYADAAHDPRMQSDHP